MGKQSAFDPGVIAVIAVMIGLPIAIVYLAMQAASTPQVGSGTGHPVEGHHSIPVPEAGLVRRGTRARLEREIETAKSKLDQARLQRAQDPVGGWDEIIASTEQEISRLNEELGGLGK